MYQSTYKLGSVNGIVCVVETSSGFTDPILIDHYWPTTLTTRNFLHFYRGMYGESKELQELLESAVVAKSYGHEFSIQLPDNAKQFINLDGGGSAHALKVEERPYPAPKTRCRVEYRDGHWHKAMARGWVRC